MFFVKKFFLQQLNYFFILRNVTTKIFETSGFKTKRDETACVDYFLNEFQTNKIF